ncbi:nuclear transport factor 2 family protein [Pseudonocardia pini]|uniref:nuclear transport factor 2 family protein n=1 Tax=Pseudonocardia pini TaxID=2758030 RepID=UPI0015F0C1F3|nr:nuclear transport factor 2 family protein [Pseudonocardia pini]
MSDPTGTDDARQIAEAFSRHDFAIAYPRLADDIRWTAHGGPTTVGRDAVVAVCEQTLADLADTTTTFTSWHVIDAGDDVVVDVIARYDGPAGTFTVASCDLYRFTDGTLSAITSYTAEVSSAAPHS